MTTDAIHSCDRRGFPRIFIIGLLFFTAGVLLHPDPIHARNPGFQPGIPEVSQEAVRHTVAAGETLYSISRRYGVTIAEIQQWNSLEGTLLSAGQELIIYTGNTPAPERIPAPEQQTPRENEIPARSIVSAPTSANTWYTVRSGDTLTRIAREHNMSTEELRRLNSIQGDLISVGQRLIVRSTRNTPVVEEEYRDSTPQGRFILYRPQRGESFQEILRRFSMSAEEMEALNPGIDLNNRPPAEMTVLLPPDRTFPNPYRVDAGLRDLGSVPATVYDDRITALTTTSGELYNPSQLTAAHANIALGTVVFVENPENGRGVHVKVNDRFSGNGIRLSRKAFEMLGFHSAVGAPTAVIYQEEP